MPPRPMALQMSCEGRGRLGVDDMCPICHEEFNASAGPGVGSSACDTDEHPRVTELDVRYPVDTRCGHPICSVCYTRLGSAACPVCRGPIDPFNRSTATEAIRQVLTLEHERLHPLPTMYQVDYVRHAFVTWHPVSCIEATDWGARLRVALAAQPKRIVAGSGCLSEHVRRDAAAYLARDPLSFGFDNSSSAALGEGALGLSDEGGADEERNVAIPQVALERRPSANYGHRTQLAEDRPRIRLGADDTRDLVEALGDSGRDPCLELEVTLPLLMNGLHELPANPCSKYCAASSVDERMTWRACHVATVATRNHSVSAERLDAAQELTIALKSELREQQLEIETLKLEVAALKAKGTEPVLTGRNATVQRADVAGRGEEGF